MLESLDILREVAERRAELEAGVPFYKAWHVFQMLHPGTSQRGSAPNSSNGW